MNKKSQNKTNTIDNEVLLLEQVKNLSEIIEQLKSILQDKKGIKTNSEIGKINFTKKEINEMPRLKEFNIRKKKNNVYEIRYRKHGYDMSFSSKNLNIAKSKAFAWLSEFEHEIRANENFQIVVKEEKGSTKNAIFGPFAENYMNNVKKLKVKDYTFKHLYNVYRNYIYSKFNAFPVSELKANIIQPYLTELNKKYERTCETVKGLFNNIFEYAVNNGVIERNPISVVFVPKHERVTGQALTKAEEKDLLNKIKGHKYEKYYLKMLYSGCRLCEINDVEEDTDNNTITIKNGKLKSYQKNLYRTIPMFPKYQECAIGDRIKVDKNKLSLEFSDICPNHTLKDLRHTFTTRARECAIDNELVAVWTGHSLGNITASVYTHFSMDFQQEQAKKLTYNVL